MVLSTIMFLQFIGFGARQFLRRDGLDTFRNRRAVLHYMWINPGIMRRAAPSYFAYFKPGFHPWRVDDRALIAGVEAELARA